VIDAKVIAVADEPTASLRNCAAADDCRYRNEIPKVSGLACVCLVHIGKQEDWIYCLSKRRYELPCHLLLAAVVNTTVVADENLTVGSLVRLPAESVAPGR